MEKELEELKKSIFEELGIQEEFYKKYNNLLNGRSSFVRKYSRLNALVDIVNTVKEEKNIDKLKKMLSELQELKRENKLEDIKNIDLEEELRNEYCQEYNVTSTKYSELSDEELVNIEGIEAFQYKGKKVIVLNGAPFRFVGRTVVRKYVWRKSLYNT